MMTTPGKSLAGDDSKAPGKPCRGQSLGRSQTRGRQGSATSPPHQRGNKHAATGMSPESLPFGGSGLKGDLLRRRGTSRRGKGPAGAARTVSRQGSCRGSPLRPLCSLWSWSWRRSASPELRPYLGSPPLPCLVWWCPWLRLPVHSYRGTKSVPLFLYTDATRRFY